MSLDLGQDAVSNEDVDEDGEHSSDNSPLHALNTLQDMPPLLDNPNPSLTYTFHSGMTPLSFTSSSAPTATQDLSPQPSTSFISSPPPSPLTPTEATPEYSMPATQSRPHGKRRDPSYIPRPPNAFILFRSAFIRDQNIPGKVEGNHSKLSKIIGICWKQLTSEERAKWEAQAVVAQAEHRARYPDWRFRPGANAMAKLKVSEANVSATRRRSVRGRVKGSPAAEGEDKDTASAEGKGKGKAKEKAKGKAKASRVPSIEEARCAKIAGFVAEGLKGVELEVAVTQWEGDRRIARPETRSKKAKVVKTRATSSKTHVRSRSDVSSPVLPTSITPSPPDKSQSDESSEGSITPTHTQTRTTRISALEDNKSASFENITNPNNVDSTSGHPSSNIPLTHMFRRSWSVPTTDRPLSSSHSSSEPSDESSTEDISPPSAEPSSGDWGTLVLQEAPIRTHTTVRRDTNPFPMPSTSAAATFDTPSLTWQEAENQRRMEDTQPDSSWWAHRSGTDQSHSQFGFEEQKGRSSERSVAFSENMGYETQQDGSQYNRGFMEEYRSYEPARDGSQHVQWNDMSASGGNRQGQINVIHDPYTDDCENDASPSISQPSTLALAPPSSGGYYYTPVSPVSPTDVPSTSYSALSGWAGEYKLHGHQAQIPSMRPWPDHSPTSAHPSSSSSMAQPGWFNHQGMYDWGDHRPQLHHAAPAADSHDWDRQEYRASNEMHLRVEPPRQVNFQEELRRQHGGS